MSIRGIVHSSLPYEVRQEVTDILEYRIADFIEFRAQLRQAHWNIKDPLFYFLHQMFDDLADQVDDITDTIAERSTSLGCLIHGTSKMVADRTTLKELDIEIRCANGLLTQLVNNCAKLAEDILNDSKKIAVIGDSVSSEVLSGATAEIDKILWFLESHLPDKPISGKQIIKKAINKLKP